MFDNSGHVESVAAEALVEWKHLFATEVRKYAKKLAVESGQGELVTLKHYQQAAKIAISKLSDAIESSESRNAQQKVA